MLIEQRLSANPGRWFPIPPEHDYLRRGSNGEGSSYRRSTDARTAAAHAARMVLEAGSGAPSAMNIACWSGPRNLSTAMMYAFGARADCDVWDEPFYASYLARTGLDHPMRHEILSAGETDPELIARLCAEPPRSGRPHVYQKHMSHHMLEGFNQDWFDAVTHVFLIRHPARVLASYAQKRENPTLADIGFVQQAAIFDAVRARGLDAVVIDSDDIRQAPETMLRALCGAIGLGFDPSMLSWPEGGHPDDGVWAPHWYHAVHRSTGFAGPEGPLPRLDAAMQRICDAALPHHDRLKSLALPRSAEPSA